MNLFKLKNIFQCICLTFYTGVIDCYSYYRRPCHSYKIPNDLLTLLTWDRSLFPVVITTHALSTQNSALFLRN